MVSDQERLSCDDLDVAVMRRFSDIRWAVCVGAGFLAVCASAVMEETPSVRTSGDEDYALRLELARIGTGERFDFSAPPGAEVCDDWEAFGAATDWFRCPFPKWSFALGTNIVDSLTIFSYGTMRPSMTNLLSFISPLAAPMGIVPQYKYGLIREECRPSRFWWYHSPSNTYVMTWQNVLLDRLADRPVSFQTEISTDGCMIFRYDLSRLDLAEVTNALAGVGSDGHERVFTRLPRDLTSLTWYRLDPDFRELTAGRDVKSTMSALGEVEPLSRPGNGEFTAWENAFYTGDPNCAGTLPVADESFAVLKVTALGSGEGNLIVGKTCVPLLPGAPALMIAVPKGVRIKTKYAGDGSVGCRLDSDDFCIGEMPSGWLVRTGWLAFPYTEPSHPCIHTLDENKVTVTLDPGSDIKGLVCTWSGNGGVSVEALSPLSARLKLDFPRNDNTYITYQLSHANYLCGKREFRQRCEYCPKVHDEEDEDGGIWYVNKDYFEDEDADPPMLGRRVCPVHHVEYSECEVEHAVKYEDATNGVPYSGQLKLHFPLQVADHRLIDVHVPTGECRCCSCPEHWKNYVAIGARSRHLAVHLGDDPFVRTTEDCTLDVFGASPSADFADATLSLCKTGVIYEAHNYTVFGVSITGYGKDLRRFNELSPEFGLPVTIQTNANDAVMLGLRTDVDLPYGTIRVAIENATARIQLVKYDVGGNHKVILDSETNPVLELPLGEWRRLTKSHTWGRTTQLSLLAYSHGKADIFFGYAAEHNGEYLHDESTQRITVIRPPLLPDYNRDGKIDDTDVWDYANGRVKYFWANNDTWTGDNAFEPYDHGVHPAPYSLPCNGDDMVVNGRNDLVNLCPLAVDLARCFNAWDKNATYEFYVMFPDKVRFVPVKTPWNEIASIVTSPQQTIYGGNLHEAELMSTKSVEHNEVPYEIPEEFIKLGNSTSGVMAVEFDDEILKTRVDFVEMRMLIRDKRSGAELFQSRVPMRILDVHDMYRWINLESECGASAAAKYNSRNRVDWPDSEHADANVIFVHGYNMHPSEAWDWSQAMFKRLWWSGMDASFTAVLWRGNETQLWMPSENAYAAKNYHQNVLNAFRSASGLKREADALPGAKKYFIAHSLGNMLVSAARQDHGLKYDKYIMLNAAVAMEAYDPGSVTTESKTVMTPVKWRGYPDRVKASHWHELFEDRDARRTLAWKGRFKDVDNTVNFYSSKDEVVANGNDHVYNVFTRKFAWYNQECDKGGHLVDLCPEAGWAFNSKYLVWDEKKGRNDVIEKYLRVRNPHETSAINDSQLMTQPFFERFSHGEIHSAIGSEYLGKRENSYAAWRALSHGIPAESFATGANPVLKWDAKATQQGSGKPNSKNSEIRNVDMETECGVHDGDWQHSYFISRSLFDVGGAFGKIIKIINTGKLVKEVK